MNWRLKQSLRRLLAYRKPWSIFGRGPARIDNLRFALAPVLVERGTDASIVVVAFTGGAEKLMVPVYEFFDTTKSLGYSRILLRDQYHRFYHRGIDDRRPDFPSVIAYLREEIERLKPKRLLCVGTSSGGYAAVRAGQQLRADYVHAFSPQTGGRPPDPRSNGRERVRPWNRRRGLPERHPAPYLDLTEVLRDWNEKTTYYIHYGRGCDKDRYYARRLCRSPGVVSIGYPCDTHLVAIFLAKRGFLTKALAIANQDRLVEIAKEHFHDGVEINQFQPEAASDRRV